jgi:hypothetical protein
MESSKWDYWNYLFLQNQDCDIHLSIYSGDLEQTVEQNR